MIQPEARAASLCQPILKNHEISYRKSALRRLLTQSC